MQLDNSYETKFIDPQAVIEQLDLAPGIKVADFGCGAGFFSLAAARKIGKDGEVYSFDILAEKLGAVESQARQAGLANIITKRANVEKAGGSGLEDGSVDWVIMKDMLFQNKDKRQILDEAARVLRKNGRALAVEWRPETSAIGPSAGLRISKDDLIALADSEHLRFIKEVEAGDFHYGLVFEK